jgi:hypothetical protein
MKKILILGGYGGVGKSLSLNLLKYTDAEITISGHNLEKVNKQINFLKDSFPNKKILPAFIDVTKKESIQVAFKNIDLVIVTTSTPDCIDSIAEVALQSNTDLIDIFVRGDVVDKLEKYRTQIIKKNRIFITQAGFHPGLPAPFIKHALDQFDKLLTANIAMAMNSKFEKPESTYEIIHEAGENNSFVLKDNVWKKANYKDAIEIEFSPDFGKLKYFPLSMKENIPLQKELGIPNMGVYVAGFNPFVDNFVFPLIVILQYFKKGFGTKFCGKLLYWGINTFYNNKPGIEFKVLSEGIKNGIAKKYTLTAYHPDPFEFTAIAVIACLKQYFLNQFEPNLYLMGNIVDHKRILKDLKQMGIQFYEV